MMGHDERITSSHNIPRKTIEGRSLEVETKKVEAKEQDAVLKELERQVKVEGEKIEQGYASQSKVP